jgi:hypothetical protein
MDQQSARKINQSYKDQQEEEQAARFVIKEEADKKKIKIP